MKDLKKSKRFEDGSFDITDRCKNIVGYSFKIASDYNQNVRTEHVLYSMFKEKHSVARFALTRLGVNEDSIEEIIKLDLNEDSNWSLEPDNQGWNMFKIAKDYSASIGDERIGPEHVLYALVYMEENYGAPKVFNNLNLNLKNIKKELEFVLGI